MGLIAVVDGIRLAADLARIRRADLAQPASYFALVFFAVPLPDALGVAGRTELGGASSHEFGVAGGAGAEIEDHFRISATNFFTASYSVSDSRIARGRRVWLSMGGRPEPGRGPPWTGLFWQSRP